MNMQADGETFAIYPREILAMLYRSWHWIIMSMLVGLTAAGVLAYTSTPTYRSAATLLIDSPQIPTALVASPLTEIADERIAKIRQQILSRDNLSDMIVRNDLFAEERDDLGSPQMLDLMRARIGVDLVGADQEQGGGSTIAFTLSFIDTDPLKAQQVTEQLAQMFMIEDKRFRTEQALGTASFLERRSEELRRQLRTLEDERREVEARYAGAVPSNVAVSAQSSSSLRAEISRIDAETQGLVQQNSLLAARQNELEHVPPAGTEGLNRARERLAQLTAIYADEFPEVVAAAADVRRQEEMLRRDPAEQGSRLLEMEIAASHDRIRVLAARRAELVGTMADLERRMTQAPQAAYELNVIEREYDNIKRQYDSLREKQLEAQVAANLQSEDKGERFTIVDQPSLPTEPLGPRRSNLMALGLAVGAALGVLLVLAYELVADKVHGAGSLSHTLKVPCFSVLPVLDRRANGGLLRRLGPWGTRPVRAGIAGAVA